MRYIIKQFLGAQAAKEPDIEVDSNLYVEGKKFIIGIFLCEHMGKQYQLQERFETQEELNKVLQNGFIIKENLNENSNQSV